MRSLYLTVLIIACELFVSLELASAEDYNFSSNVDLSSISFAAAGGRYQDEAYYYFTNPLPTFNLNVGDTVNGTITFANSGKLVLSNGSSSEASMLGFMNFVPSPEPGTQNFTSSSEMQLLSLTGDIVNVSNPSSDHAPSTNIVGSAVEVTYTNQILFSGFDYSITFDSFSGSHTFSPQYFGVLAGANDISIQSAPEPSSVPLTLGGLGVLVFFLLRKHLQSRSITS